MTTLETSIFVIFEYPIYAIEFSRDESYMIQILPSSNISSVRRELPQPAINITSSRLTY